MLICFFNRLMAYVGSIDVSLQASKPDDPVSNENKHAIELAVAEIGPAAAVEDKVEPVQTPARDWGKKLRATKARLIIVLV